MGRRIWDGDDLTPEVVREWGYDEGLLLMEQDEEVLLHDIAYVPVLLELAGDDGCPKQEYVFYILCDFIRGLALARSAAGVDMLEKAYSYVSEPVVGLVRQWHEYVGRLLSYARPSGRVDRVKAVRMAADLLRGAGNRIGAVVESKADTSGWRRFTLRTGVVEHLEVCAATGEYRYKIQY